MSVIRIKKARTPYVTLNTTALNDARLSFRAKGLHTYLMSKPDDWQVYIAQLEKESPKEGREAVSNALKELEQAGYLRRARRRGAKGRMTGWDTTIYETPELAQADGEETPVTENGLADIGLSEVGLTEVGSTEVGKTATTYSGSYSEPEFTKSSVSNETEARAHPAIDEAQIQQVLDLIHHIPMGLRAYANVFHTAVVDALCRMFPHWPIHREYPTTYSDGRNGRLDIYIDTVPAIAIELDAGTIRQRSLHKLRQLSCVRIIGLRTVTCPPTYKEELGGYAVGAAYVEGATVVIPVVGKESTRAKKHQRLRTDYTVGFNTWWGAYPPDKRVSKPACFTVWLELGLEVRAVELVEKIERLKITTWAHVSDRKYIKTSLPYLNDGRYEDDLVPLDAPRANPSDDSPFSKKGMSGVRAAQRIIEETQRNGTPGSTPLLPSLEPHGGVFQRRTE